MREFLATGPSALTIMRVYPIERTQAVRSSLPVRKKSTGRGELHRPHRGCFLDRDHLRHSTDRDLFLGGVRSAPRRYTAKLKTSHDRPPSMALGYRDLPDLHWATTRPAADSPTLLQGLGQPSDGHSVTPSLREGILCTGCVAGLSAFQTR